jgi:hypothetical protein
LAVMMIVWNPACPMPASAGKGRLVMIKIIYIY